MYAYEECHDAHLMSGLIHADVPLELPDGVSQ